MNKNECIKKINKFLNEDGIDDRLKRLQRSYGKNPDGSKGNYKGVESSGNGYVVKGDYTFTGKLDKPILLVSGNVKVDPSVTSLEGCPEEVEGDFNCKNCNSLTSLKGAPKIVYGKFSCSGCKNLKTLEGAPEKVGSFFCRDCTSLTTLEGAPKDYGYGGEAGGVSFDCSDCKNLISLKGIENASDVHGFICRRCVSLKSLKGCPADDSYYAFVDCEGCKSLKSFDENFDLSEINCAKCINLVSIGNLDVKYDATFKDCRKLSKESIDILHSLECEEGVIMPNGMKFNSWECNCSDYDDDYDDDEGKDYEAYYEEVDEPIYNPERENEDLED